MSATETTPFTSRTYVREPMLESDGIERYTLFPLKHHDIWTFYKKSVASFWTPEEIDLAHDRNDFETLTENEKFFILRVLAFFASSDLIVNQNIEDNVLSNVHVAEVAFFYQFQMMIENIHSEVYSQLIDTYVRDGEQKTKLFHAIETLPCVKLKADWMLRWISSETSFHERLVAFACAEGIFFSASFAAIFWMKKRGKMPGLCFANELISRDEGMHCDFACLLYKKLQNKLRPERIREIVGSAVEAECEFVTDSLPFRLIGLNADTMCEYVKFCADRLLVALDQDKMYGAKQPFEWMSLISVQRKTNFFESRVSEYGKAGVLAEGDTHEFTLDADF